MILSNSLLVTMRLYVFAYAEILSQLKNYEGNIYKAKNPFLKNKLSYLILCDRRKKLKILDQFLI